MNSQDQQNGDRIVRNIDYLQVLKNRWKEVFLVFLLVLVISVVVTFLMPPAYQTRCQFQIKLPKPVMEIGQGGTWSPPPTSRPTTFPCSTLC